jgi:tRNA (cmo5U34)-methyltransferase
MGDKKKKGKDQTSPDKKWEFDEEVTAVFENMLERSIPQYELMRQLIFSVGQKFVTQGSDILDLGCSKGDSMADFVAHFGACNRFIGVEVSKPMLEASKKRFANLIDLNMVNILDLDLRKEFPNVVASLILSILTIQFTPIEYRQNIMEKVYDSLAPGGAFIFVEKILGNSAVIDAILVDLYYGMKSENDYTKEQIQRKKASLEGVLVPMTAKANEDLLRTAGFVKVDCFWRCLNFAGWVAIK